MVVSVTIATIVGIIGAWAGATLESSGRAGRRFAAIFMACMVACVALPLILHAAAWEATAGKFGWLPLTQTGSRASGLTAFGAFGGLTACGWIHGLFGSAIVTLATWHGTRTVPRAVIDQAHLELSPQATWWRIRLPLSLPWMISGLMFTAILAATEMTVADLYGFRTIADQFYLYFAVNPSSTSLVVTCVLPLLIAAALILVVSPVRGQHTTVRRREKQTSYRSQHPGRLQTSAAASVASVLMLMLLAVPFMGLLVKIGHQVTVSGDEIQVRWSAQQALVTTLSAPRDFASEYGWTFAIAGLAGLAAVMVSWPLSAWGRSSHRIERVLDVVSIVVFVIPGPIVGLSIVRCFQIDFPGFAHLHQRTLVPTMIALLFRAAPIAYWTLRAGYRVMDTRLVDAAKIDGNVWRRMWCIDRPMMGTSFFVAFFGASLMASGDVPVTLPVVPPGVSTVGTRLFGLLHSGARQQEAALAIWYVGVCVLVALIGLGLARKRLNRPANDENAP